MFDFLAQKFSSIFSRITGQGKLSQENVTEALDKVRDALLEADVPYDVIEQFIKEVQHEVIGTKLVGSLKPAEMLVKIVNDKLVSFLGGATESAFTFQIPSIVMVMGLQGSGKTTTTAKLAHLITEQAKQRGKSRRVMVASVDFNRPAAIDQLEILAKRAGVLFYRSPLTEPVSAAQDIVKKFQQEQADILLLDTAGRLHVDDQLLEELQKIDAKIKSKYKVLIIDAMTGQESLKIARSFEDKVGFMGAILTKMDSDTRGGVAFAFRYALKKPVLYVATGEKLEDLEQFRPERMASRIMGMGDIQTLIEKAEQKIKHSEQESMAKSFSQGRITLDDFAQQMGMMSKLGSLSSIMKYMPGMGSLSISPEMIEKGEQEMKKFKAIISSMTRKERIAPQILDASRKKRIASGAGVQVSEVNTLLSRFEQSQQFVKMFKKMGKDKLF